MRDTVHLLTDKAENPVELTIANKHTLKAIYCHLTTLTLKIETEEVSC